MTHWKSEGGREEGRERMRGQCRGRLQVIVLVLQLRACPHGPGQDILGYGELWTSGEGLSGCAIMLGGKRSVCLCGVWPVFITDSNSVDLPQEC